VAQLISQMAGALARPAEGVTDVALSPEELGRVQMTVQTDARDPDRVVLFLTFDRPETLDLFRRHVDELTEAMRAAGFAQAEIGFGSSGSGAGSGDRQPGGAALSSGPSAGGERAGEPSLEQSDRPAAMGSGLNLRL
jgi:hypothetical protein